MPRRREYSPEVQCEIVGRYESGVTAQRISRDLGVGFASVKRVLEAHGAYEHGRKFRGRLSEVQKADMVDRYLAGETQRQLAQRFSCERTNIHILLKARGVQLRPPRTYPLSGPDGARLAELRAEGLNFKQIASRMDVPHHRALAWARQLGISDFQPKRGAESPGWAGGRHQDKQGYWHVRLYATDPLWVMANQNSYAPEHRVVLARSLGRPLTKGESVHHINGDRADNRLENLQLRQHQHGRGVAHVCLDCGSHNVGATPIAQEEST